LADVVLAVDYQWAAEATVQLDPWYQTGVDDDITLRFVLREALAQKDVNIGTEQTALQLLPEQFQAYDLAHKPIVVLLLIAIFAVLKCQGAMHKLSLGACDLQLVTVLLEVGEYTESLAFNIILQLKVVFRVFIGRQR
jgi:hypothetical protein